MSGESALYRLEHYGCVRCGYMSYAEIHRLAGAVRARLCPSCLDAWEAHEEVMPLLRQDDELEARLKLYDIEPREYAIEREKLVLTFRAVALEFVKPLRAEA